MLLLWRSEEFRRDDPRGEKKGKKDRNVKGKVVRRDVVSHLRGEDQRMK